MTAAADFLHNQLHVDAPERARRNIDAVAKREHHEGCIHTADIQQFIGCLCCQCTAGGRIARMLGTKKFGHIGTLDPMATGVLPIAIGDATKMIPFVEDVNPSVKEYLFSLQFGYETDTLDITGQETARDNFIPSVADVIAVLPKLSLILTTHRT